MGQLKHCNYRIVFLLLIVWTINANAKSYNWDNISQQQYNDNLVSCQIDLQQLKWSKNIWSQQNKTPKPAFSTVLDVDKVHKQVLDNLKLQSILLDRFNIGISDEILQNDLNRMAANSKDAKGLKQLFGIFNNDAATIAQCISLPNLVKGKIQNLYNYDSEIHGLLKAQAQIELQAYLDENTIKNLEAQVSTVTFAIKQQTPAEEQIIELSKQEFTNKVQQLQNSSLEGNLLQEKKYGFIYTEIIQQTQDELTVKTLSWQKTSFNQWVQSQGAEIYTQNKQNKQLKLPEITGSNNLAAIKVDIKVGGMINAWEPTSTGANVPSERGEGYTAIWTGSQMIIWGGSGDSTGGRYDPDTDSWQATSTGTNVPEGRNYHTAIWTGSEMIIWGGYSSGFSNTGGRYNPATDSWQPTSTGANIPSGRLSHTAIWTGSEMIIWGGYKSDGQDINTGGRYDPAADSWLATSTGANVPSVRSLHTAIWTGSEMIIWGGRQSLNTGGRYDPAANSWQPTSTSTNVPEDRARHTAIWTGSQMIIWGGYSSGYLNTGGRYDPGTDSWQPTSTSTNIPEDRAGHTAIWTGSEMIIWGGYKSDGQDINTGGRYDPAADIWQPTSTGTNVPEGRSYHRAIWTGSQMIIWGGGYDEGRINTGGRYDPNFHSEVGGNVIGLLGNQLTLQNNGVDDLSIDANGAFIFATALDDLSTYDVTVLTQPTSPNQTCVVTDGTGSINGAYIVDVSIECNTEPTAVADVYTSNEDETLTANDVNGSVNDANDDGMLANDSDAELNPLSVLNPGTFTTTGIGGTIVISTDGTFIYTSPADVSGQADFDFEVTDGINVVSSSLSINVLAVNDVPSFTVFGGIDVIDLIGGGHTHIRVTDFAGNIIFGPADESDQNIQQFDLSVDDNDSILTDISLGNNGTLDIDFSLNYGIALIDVTLQDDGGTANGGVDTSETVEFFVAHIDLVFADGFESIGGLRLFDYLDSISMTYPHNSLPIYDFNDDSLHFYGHTLQLDNDYGSAKVMLLVKHWLQAVLIKEGSLGDYDLDGILNVDDKKPFEF